MATELDLIVPADLTFSDELARIRGFVTSGLGRPVHDGENFFATGLVSSLFGVELLTFIENSFAVEVTDEDLVLDNFASVRSICGFVWRKRQSLRSGELTS
jgi:acyl carrier protein